MADGVPPYRSISLGVRVLSPKVPTNAIVLQRVVRGVVLASRKLFRALPLWLHRASLDRDQERELRRADMARMAPHGRIDCLLRGVEHLGRAAPPAHAKHVHARLRGSLHRYHCGHVGSVPARGCAYRAH